MSDRICLEVNGKRIEHFLSYSIDADLYVADNCFSLELASPEIEIKAGMRCKLFVNNKLELTGIIDRTVSRCDKSGRSLVVEGRDLMGLLVDSYCEEFMTIDGKTLPELAELLIGPDKVSGRPGIPFIHREKIVFQDNIIGKLPTHRRQKRSHKPIKYGHILPGMTIFQVLRTYALSQGMLFYSLPDGTFEFGRPLATGPAEYSFILNKAGLGVNILRAEKQEDVSRGYSKVVVMGQRQGEHLNITQPAVDATDEEKNRYTETLLVDLKGINYQAIIEDNTFPFRKVYVACDNGDSQDPMLPARTIMESMRYSGFKLIYEVPRHSQNGRNYTINKIARVEDEINNIDGAYLIYKRTFSLNKQSGPTTTLILGHPGLVYDGPIRRHPSGKI